MWLLDPSLTFLGLEPWQIFLILLVPIIVDLPRILGKAVLLLSQTLCDRLRKPRFQYRHCPLVSIIVPAHNEEQIVARSIQCLLENDYPRKEVIVVDDGSTDKTYQIAHLYSQKGLIKLMRREQASGRKARAVNLGLRLAKGDIITVVDADTLLEVTAISNMVKYFADPEVGAVAGNVRVGNQINLLTKLQAYEYIIAMEMGRRYQALVGLLLIVPGAFGAVRREILSSVGAYDIDTITEDFDLTVKVHKMQKKVKFAKDAIAWTVVPEKIRTLIRQRTRWALGQMQTLRKHRNVFFRSRFGIVGLVGAPEMVFADMILTFLRFGWLGYMMVTNLKLLVQILSLALIFYFLLELTQALVVCILSPRGRDFIYILYLPIMVFLYRPLLSFIRFRTYLKEIKGEMGKW